MTRHTQAMARWSELATGNPSPETLAWVADVARAVMGASQAPAGNPRRLAMLRAVQMDGRRGNERYAIRLLAEHFKITEWAAVVDKRPMRELVGLMLGVDQSGVPILDTEAVDARIRRALAD